MPETKNIISSWVKIAGNKVKVNGAEVFPAEQNLEFPEFIRNLYKHFQFSYTPFFKMDNMCKLGFCAAELLARHEPDFNKEPESTGIILSNNSSSLDTDIAYYDTFKDKDNYFPSPAVFVYTLPNIAIGEIAIRHKIKGENTFFVSENFDSQFIASYIEGLLNSEKLSACMAGWLEFFNGKYEAFFYFAQTGAHLDENKRLNAKLHSFKTVQELYTEI